MRNEVANTLGITRVTKCYDDRDGTGIKPPKNCYEDLRAASVIMNKFYKISNDGVVPIDSGIYQEHNINVHYWDGYDHADMRDDKGGVNPLFDSIKIDLELIFNTSNILTVSAAEYFIDIDQERNKFYLVEGR